MPVISQTAPEMPRYYSLRRMAPYQGTVQVVQVAGARAFSSDGETWQVQVLRAGAAGPAWEGDISGEGLRVRGFAAATWRADGSGSMIETGHTTTLVRALEQSPPLPFPSRDRLELWLLDAREAMPLALLDTTLPHMPVPNMKEVDWQGRFPPDPDFTAPSLSLAGARESCHSPVAHGEILRRMLQVEAGSLARAQWFFRETDGGGQGRAGCRLDPDLRYRHLPATAFPELLIREQGWGDGPAKELVRDYHDWCAPDLLTHAHLRPETRGRLERAARRRAGRLYALRRVLPAVIDRELVRTLFVEAVIRRSVASPGA